MGFDAAHIRPLSVAVVRRGNQVLAMKAFDYKKGCVFYRLPGGGIEFGEKAEEAVCREWKEELGAELKIIRRLGVEESIFVYEGQKGHEIVFFFEAELEESDYRRPFVMLEKGFEKTEIVWVDLDDQELIYPEAFRKFI